MASTTMETSPDHRTPSSNASDIEKATNDQETPQEEHPAPIGEKPAPPTANQTSAVPNGGLQAWLQVLSGFMLFFNR